LDQIFASLAIGYFSLKQYEKVAECYKRYKKSTNGNSVNEENDITICAYYYASQWITTERKQYAEKLYNTFEATEEKENLKHVGVLIKNIMSYYNVPFPKK
jgi:hypothetical protein